MHVKRDIWGYQLEEKPEANFESPTNSRTVCVAHKWFPVRPWMSEWVDVTEGNQQKCGWNSKCHQTCQHEQWIIKNPGSLGTLAICKPPQSLLATDEPRGNPELS